VIKSNFRGAERSRYHLVMPLASVITTAFAAVFSAEIMTASFAAVSSVMA